LHAVKKLQRRAWDSNPQPVARHLNSNQLQTVENAGDFDDSSVSAAQGAAVGAENGVEPGPAAGCMAGQGTAPVAVADPDLALVVDRWQALADPIRVAILSLVRSGE
jgi:hypothetical protein